jgi:hypothetical protein
MANLTLMAYDSETETWCECETVEDGAQVNAWITSPSKFEVHKNGAAQAIVTATWTKLTWATEVRDEGGDFDLANDKYVVPADGDYEFSGCIQIDAIAAGKVVYVALYKGGVIWKNCVFDGTHGLGGDGKAISIQGYCELNDEIEVYVYHNHGANRNIDGTITNTHWEGHRI